MLKNLKTCLLFIFGIPLVILAVMAAEAMERAQAKKDYPL